MISAQICIQQDHLILGSFGIHASSQGSIISKSPLPLKDFSKRETLYKSELNDLGHLVCDFDKDSIAFIKNNGTSTNPEYDIANLNITTKAVSELSQLKTVSNIINMDGTLLTLEKGKYYIVKGNIDYKNIDTLKAKPETNNESKKNDDSSEDADDE
jgi:hypothetical protein